MTRKSSTPTRDMPAPLPDHLLRDKMIGRLVARSGPRRTASEAMRSQVRRAAHDAWQKKIQARDAEVQNQDTAEEPRYSTQRPMIWALAATLVLAAGIAVLLSTRTPWAPRTPVATVDARFGDATNLPMPGTELRAGDRVETAEGRLALRLEGGASVRLDRATRLVLNSTSVLELEAGAIYIDTGIDGVGGLEVRTDYGVARDIGTQFETRLGEGRLSLVVREGEVLFMGEGGEYRAGAGVALSLGPDGGVTRERVEASDPRWSWASAAAPPFDIEGRSLAEVLTWVARETGWTVRYEDAELERSAAQMLTHGSTGGLEPELVPDLVVPVAGLEHQLQGSVLRVERP